ncbi:pyridoxal-phosphate-dependent aminotransferase family protein [Helicobacter mustelae]|uniref:Putative Serine-pyruvate/aspartate aminotransferase class-V n=1 Tax=Helicobacter mustelae (strain ATCC 43772 / CCUG 25715 / CIP 103759 / LMG 18044 / NCTC 12198 / R85-136P) TaxID=679897 RepID=D3UFZ7_HELM1|nr:alanine--glyoxylate aminotransferase family protein [Helicobacter mustelae]CBG39418.1 Putative Serine-pyruvate/aspartate aminotransferase class-V [Helicobacter mustelae 12198]SQH70931.1 serine-pyruvate/aspartate aminotransferase class-V [Helicobacter mustelae]STP12057.1 serine-pyruvate/aspartate aminotransferase class-V [Helicobacter mustelae]
MKEKTFLMIPGPTPVPQSVLQASARHPIGHRSPEFSQILREVFLDLKEIFQTKNPVFVYAASGTGAMCGALENVLNPGDRVLCLVIGNFGERWVKIAKSRGAMVEVLQADPGEVIHPKDLESMLQKFPDTKAVTLTHSETSTGAANDVKSLCAIIQKSGALAIVDGITSLCAMPCKMDEWGIDILVSGSQKGFMLPPGLAFLSASKKAMEAREKCLYPSFYFDFLAHQKALEKNTTPYTPAVNLVFGLHEALKLLKEEGIEKINARHKRFALSLRQAIRAMGLELFVKEDKNASFAITSILPPSGIDVPSIRRVLKEDFDVLVANGQNALENKIFRIGTLGYVCERDLISAVAALEATLYKLGHSFALGSGVKTLIQNLKNT